MNRPTLTEIRRSYKYRINRLVVQSDRVTGTVAIVSPKDLQYSESESDEDGDGGVLDDNAMVLI